MNVKLLRLVEPYENESLTSIIIRPAKANYCPINLIIHELKKYKFERIGIPQFLNFVHTDPLIKALAQITNLTEDRVIDLTIFKYNRDPWNLDLHLFGSKSNKGIYGYASMDSKYCPLCLEEKLYHRLYWHLDQVIICVKHKIYLVDHCLNCGRKLSAVEFSLGECKCGRSLINIPINSIDNLIILRNQIKFYDVFEISRYTEFDFIKKELYLGLDKSDYLNLIRLLIFFVQLANEKNTYLDCMIKVEQVLEDWPKNYIFILNDLFEIYISNKLYIIEHEADFCFYAHKPKRTLSLRKTTIEKVGFFSKCFYQILNNFYSREYIGNKFESILFNGKLIGLEDLESYFLIDADSIKLLFNIINVNEREYIEFDEVMNFFQILIENKMNVSIKSLYKPITEIYKFSKGIGRMKDITMFDILEVIKRPDIGYFIFPFYFGLDMIYAPENRILRELRQLIKRDGYLGQGFTQNQLHF